MYSLKRLDFCPLINHKGLKKTNSHTQPATLNKAEFTILASLAQSKKLFLMEAVWTRFFPLTFALQDLLFKQKVIGDIKRVVSDFSIDFVHGMYSCSMDSYVVFIFYVVVDENHRMRNPRLAGGGLLDLGPYPLVWCVFILFYSDPSHKLTWKHYLKGHDDSLPSPRQ